MLASAALLLLVGLFLGLGARVLLSLCFGLGVGPVHIVGPELWRVWKKKRLPDEDGIRTHACRAHWISSPTP